MRGALFALSSFWNLQEVVSERGVLVPLWHRSMVGQITMNDCHTIHADTASSGERLCREHIHSQCHSSSSSSSHNGTTP